MMELKELRKKHKMSQATFAIKIGISLPTYIMWERGGITPNAENKAKLEIAIYNLEKEAK